MRKKEANMGKLFNRFSEWVMVFTGSPKAFFIALVTIIIWAICGPIFKFSDTWQLVINTSTTIITFLMVFIIQQSQNRDTLAIHLKLNELIAVNGHASNRLVSSEDLTEEELRVLKKFYQKLSTLSREDGQSIHKSHSIDEAENNHKAKTKAKRST
ncbi:MAG: low affinity iron permease family protein [Bacteroidetes bacterium]|nr:low affinity iron permease family protein [Bacteroidota bacterium]